MTLAELLMAFFSGLMKRALETTASGRRRIEETAAAVTSVPPWCPRRLTGRSTTPTGVVDPFAREAGQVPQDHGRR
jgi:hypothetical protein